MNGIVLINKPKGISSFGVVSKVRKIYNTKKVGHCGTLDPEATGVLPVMVGNATKISKYLVEHDKEYEAILKLGVKTDSGDGEGEVLERDEFVLDSGLEDEYRKNIESVAGKMMQVPPMYSAIKVDGKKLYEYARQGINVERQAREIEIYDIEVLGFDYINNEVSFRVKCSKGTYIRTLCEDIAERLGTIGYMKELNRTMVDDFSIENSFTLEEVEELEDKGKCLISLEEIFDDRDEIILNNRKLELFLNGVKLTFDLDDGIYKIFNNDKFIGIGVVKEKLLKRDVIVR